MSVAPAHDLAYWKRMGRRQLRRDFVQAIWVTSIPPVVMVVVAVVGFVPLSYLHLGGLGDVLAWVIAGFAVFAGGWSFMTICEALEKRDAKRARAREPARTAERRIEASAPPERPGPRHDLVERARHVLSQPQHQ